MTYCNVNGQLVAANEAFVSTQDRGFRFGDGVFETLAVQEGVPCYFDWHIERLTHGLEAIKIAFDVRQLQTYCRELIHKNKVTHSLLRIQVTRGIGSLGYLPDPAHPQAGAFFVIETPPMPVIPKDPVALWQSSYTKISPRALPVQYKLCQGLNSILARIEAREQHCADALLLNENGQLCETSSGNIFWFKEGKLYTPDLNCGVLEGATREAVLRLSPYPVSEVEADMRTLLKAEAIFITNVVWQSLAVNHLLPLGKDLQSMPIAGQFQRMLEEDRAHHSAKQRNQW